MPEAMLRVERMTKRFGRFKALDEVSFSIRGGEILGLIGPNGAGKTTLFECIAGVLPADGGAVTEGSRDRDPQISTGTHCQSGQSVQGR